MAFRILSIDGGGIRGILPATILASLEKKLQLLTRDPETRLSDYFDFFAGTSTGGILSLIYLCPEGRTKNRFSAQEALNFYTTYGPDIFRIPFKKKVESVFGIIDEKLDARNLDKIFKRFLGDIKLSQLLKPAMITAYDIERRSAFFFKVHKALMSKTDDFYLRDVARSTSAVPAYFEVPLVKSMAGDNYALIDGGVFANNPAMCAFSELVRLMGNDVDFKNVFIFSVGTGHKYESYSYENAKNWGAVEWAIPVLDIMLSGISETVDYQLNQLFYLTKNYIRINPKLYTASTEMDDGSKKNIKALQIDGEKNTMEYDYLIEQIAKRLLRNE